MLNELHLAEAVRRLSEFDADARAMQPGWQQATADIEAIGLRPNVVAAVARVDQLTPEEAGLFDEYLFVWRRRCAQEQLGGHP